MTESARGQITAPRNSTQLMGTRYFRQVIITWSIRSLGSVQRIQICTQTSNEALPKNTPKPSRLASQLKTKPPEP